MNDIKKYLFKSDRLGFRNWDLSDINKMHEINSDEKVMAFFPSITSKGTTTTFKARLKIQNEILEIEIIEPKNFKGHSVGTFEQTKQE